MSKKLVELPRVKIVGIKEPKLAILGGMGAGGTRWQICGPVAECGWTANISSVASDRIVGHEIGRKISQYDALQYDIAKSRERSGGNGAISVNIMVALQNSYEECVRAAVDAQVDSIVFGAGLPLTAPGLVGENYKGALVIIVSSARVLETICGRWMNKYDRVPDAVIVEGTRAGGHLGFKFEQIFDDDYRLEKLIAEVKEVAVKWGNIPVIAAGGIWDHEDVVKIVDETGVDGFQVATRFVGTNECTLSQKVKEAAVTCQQDDIIIATDPGSPAGMLFRILKKQSPGYEKTLAGEICEHCLYRYLSRNGGCRAMEMGEHYPKAFCICRALLDACGVTDSGYEICTVGANVWRLDGIYPATEVVDSYTGITK